MTEVDRRTRHYGGFYFGVEPDDDRPLLLVGGNCQAEAFRVALSTAPDVGFRTVPVPLVHELVDSDVPHAQLLAARVLDELGEPSRPADAGRTLLETTKSPREARVPEALDLPVSEARDGWQHAGQSWTADDVRAAQLAWYAERPAVVTAGLQRYDDLIARLGLDVG